MNCPNNIERFVELADGLLTGESLSEFEDHIAGCLDCRVVAAELARLAPPGETALPWLADGDRVGRYVIRGWLGGGAMGQVFAAEDPQLGRPVAIKLPRTDEGPGRERLMLEAKAMAQLVHPNVVRVYDAGIATGRPFIAMELVVGESLAQWLLEGRAWPEILAAFVAAGHGLAAAHRAGLLHRDFKPANALIAEDGRVLVTDFGLATGAGIESLELGLERAPIGSPDEARVTATGALIGTPAYMAPEQLKGLAASEQSDQFSFAVSLYEALNRHRPFSDARPTRALELIADGPAPPSGRAPTAVSRALVKALDAEPGRRYESMDALLAALAHGARARQRRAMVAVGALAAMAIGAGGWAIASGGTGSDAEAVLCGDPSAEMSAVWNPERKRQIAAAFAAVARPYAVDNGQRIERAVDGYAESWTEGRREACRAVADHSESPELSAERRACFDSHRAYVDAFAVRLLDVDGDSLDHIATAAHRLPAIEECSHGGILARIKPAPDQAIRAEVLRLESAFRAAGIEATLGSKPEAIAALGSLAQEAAAIGYKPLQADINNALASYNRLGGNFEAARASSTVALAAAQTSSYRLAVASSNLEFALIALADEATPDSELRRWTDLARASVTGLEGDGPMDAKLAHFDAFLALRDGNIPDARAALERQVEIERKIVGPESPALAMTMTNLGSMYLRLGEYELAATTLDASRRILEEAYGLYHTDTMAASNNLATALIQLGRIDEALAMQRDQVRRRTVVHGEQSAEVAYARQNLAFALKGKGDAQAAVKEARAALEALVAVQGSDHTATANAGLMLGGLLVDAGQPAEAVAAIRPALAALEAKLGPEHPQVGTALINLGWALSDANDASGAVAALERAHRIFVGRLSAEHPQAVTALYGLGRARVAAGQIDRGIADFMKARSIGAKLTPTTHASLELELAEALLEHRRDRAGARLHAEAARALVADQPEHAAEVDAFLKKL